MCERRICKVLSLLMCLMLLWTSAGAENLWDDLPASDETVQSGTEEVIEQGIDGSGGTLVNPDPDHDFTDAQATEYSYTPLDVVLVLDTSGSMASIAAGGQQVLSLAQEAAVVFVETLFSLSAPSRVGLVSFESQAHQLTAGFLGLTDEIRLKQTIRGTLADGQTNTGAAFNMAGRMLDAGRRGDARQVVVMLTDGIPVGGGDPISNAIRAGRSLGGTDALVYTIGLVGALPENDKKTTRQVLHDGYETRYFEVDNKRSGSGTLQDMNGYTYVQAVDIAKSLSDIFTGICMAAMAEDDQSGSYIISTDSSLDIRVTDGRGGYLSSDPMDFRDETGFGHLSIVGEGKDQKSVILTDGDYTVTLRGTTTRKGSYSITRHQGYSMRPVTLASAQGIDTHPAQVLRFDIHGLECGMTDLSWDPLDHEATDLFTGAPTRGSETAASGRLTGAEKLYAWTNKKAVQLLSLKKGGFVQVLASDRQASWYLIATTDQDGRLCRGWLPAGAVSVDGYVPVLIEDEPARTYTVLRATEGLNAPAAGASVGRAVKAGETVTAVHAERDHQGREWVYVRLPGKKDQAAWVDAACLQDWQTVSPAGFHIGYALPTLVWQKSIGGNGFTEFMWAASRTDGGGVAVSGRSSSSGGAIRAKYKNKDAVALLLTPAGEIERSTVVGGTGSLDSFHCILPVADGYYVSGVTRSNNKDFEGIWDRSTFSGKTKSTSDRANALIGKLRPNLSIDWMKSFGTGRDSFGFDMVLETSDGMIAGSGWMTANSSFSLRGNGRQDFLAMKLDRNGNVISYNNYGGSGEDVPDSAVATEDGGLIMVGNVGGDSRGTGLIYVLDADLRQVNRVTYGGSQSDIFDNIRDMGDGTYLVTGFTGSYSSSVDYWAMQIDAMGRMIWYKTYGGTGREEVCGTTVLPNGSFLLVGYTTSTNGIVQGGTGRGKDAWVTCIDRQGRLLWQFTSGLNGDDYFNSACVDPADGGIVLCGSCEYKNDKNAKGYVVKIMAPEALQ